MSPTTPHISFIGDLTVDVYPQKNQRHLCGSSLNAAMWAKHLGTKPSIVAAVGDDQAGREYVNVLTREHIDGSRISILHGRTSVIEINITAGGERQYGDWDPGVMARYHLSKDDFAFLKKHDATLLTVYGPTRHLLDELVTFGLTNKKRKPLVAVDFGDLVQFEKSFSVVESAIDGIDMAFFGLDKDNDERLINDVQQLAASARKLCIVTLGQHGSVAFDGEKIFMQAPQSVSVKDTTGAGDAFIAGFLVSYLQTRNIQKSLEQGTILASSAIQKVGAY
ncbi:hypothetical protein HY948_03715 [Candidatus Gottesmanbacteria bacterium]|nr:hypothetical protein [Candidatus Gottesmanbacteria bacterium]